MCVLPFLICQLVFGFPALIARYCYRSGVTSKHNIQLIERLLLGVALSIQTPFTEAPLASSSADFSHCPGLSCHAFWGTDTRERAGGGQATISVCHREPLRVVSMGPCHLCKDLSRSLTHVFGFTYVTESETLAPYSSHLPSGSNRHPPPCFKGRHAIPFPLTLFSFLFRPLS